MKISGLSVVMAAWCACAAALAQPIEVIPLRHRSAEQLLPVLQPLLAPGGVLTGSGYDLYVRTTPANLAQIRSVLATLDRAQRRLVISVSFDTDVQENRRAIEARGSLRRSDVSVGAAAVPATEGRIEIGIRDTDTRSQGRIAQQIQVLEGGRAHITAGTTRSGLYGAQEIDTGFEVVPRIAGDIVLIEIAAQRKNAGRLPGSTEGQRVATTIQARLGEWVEVGGASASETREDRGLLARGERTRADANRVWLKVDEVRP